MSGEIVSPFETTNIRLAHALYIPALGYNLVSTGCLVDNGIESHFRRFHVFLKLEEGNEVTGSGQNNASSGMYVLPSPTLSAQGWCDGENGIVILSQFQYVCTIFDDFSTSTFISFLRHRDEVS